MNFLLLLPYKLERFIWRPLNLGIWIVCIIRRLEYIRVFVTKHFRIQDMLLLVSTILTFADSHSRYEIFASPKLVVIAFTRFIIVIVYYIVLTFYIEHCTPNFLWPFFVPFCKLLYVWSGWENEISLSLCFLACTEFYVLHTTWTTIFLEGKKAVVIPSYTSDWVTWREIWHNFGKWKIPLIFFILFSYKNCAVTLILWA